MKKPIQILLIIAAIISFAFINNTTDSRKINVVIDAGHGGHDFGAKHNEHLEKDITAQISKRIAALNSNQNIVLHFTRSDDSAMDLAARTAFINEIKPDLVLSLHVTANPRPEARGVDLFTAVEGANAARSAELAKKLGSALETKNQLKIRGQKTAPFFILKNSKAPAITLELGFITNPEDFKYLTNEQEQEKIAKTILEFISEL